MHKTYNLIRNPHSAERPNATANQSVNTRVTTVELVATAVSTPEDSSSATMLISVPSGPPGKRLRAPASGAMA